MSNYKNLNHYNKDQIKCTLDFIIKKKYGFIMGCFFDNELIGGIVCINQGNRTEYFIGISHPEFRKLPINHLGIYESILHAKNCNQNVFDMGGIVLNAKEDDQLYSIGEFKKDFSKKIVEFNPEISIITNEFHHLIKNCYLYLTKLLNK
jgi:lipid II:glycine glycyltransferase (peptidoglycan interpeptide bridge formation enzyme)